MSCFRGARRVQGLFKDPSGVTLLALALLCLGLVLPFFQLRPQLTEDWILQQLIEDIIGLDFTPEDFSILGGIKHLYRGDLRDKVIGTVLVLFSVVFPVAKLIGLLVLSKLPIEQAQRCHTVLNALAPWSMLEIYVAAVMVVSFKAFPGGTRITPRIGLFVFIAAIMVSMWATILIKNRLAAHVLHGARKSLRAADFDRRSASHPDG
jgi:hypothetical protein